MHLARPNPVWPALHAQPVVLLSVVDDYAYVPSTWRAKAGGPDEDGVPTSSYAAVQFTCRAEVIDDPEHKADLLRRQLAHFQPEGDYAPVAVGQAPYGRMLAGIRGLRLHVQHVAAKFKYDDHNPHTHRDLVARRLEQRAEGRDHGAAHQQRRRLQQAPARRPVSGDQKPPSNSPLVGPAAPAPLFPLADRLPARRRVGVAVEATATFVKHTPRSGGQAARPSRASTRVVRSASGPTVMLGRQMPSMCRASPKLSAPCSIRSSSASFSSAGRAAA